MASPPRRGYPKTSSVDSGTESYSNAMGAWALGAAAPHVERRVVTWTAGGGDRIRRIKLRRVNGRRADVMERYQQPQPLNRCDSKGVGAARELTQTQHRCPRSAPPRRDERRARARRGRGGAGAPAQVAVPDDAQRTRLRPRPAARERVPGARAAVGAPVVPRTGRASARAGVARRPLFGTSSRWQSRAAATLNTVWTVGLPLASVSRRLTISGFAEIRRASSAFETPRLALAPSSARINESVAAISARALSNSSRNAGSLSFSSRNLSNPVLAGIGTVTYTLRPPRTTLAGRALRQKDPGCGPEGPKSRKSPAIQGFRVEAPGIEARSRGLRVGCRQPRSEHLGRSRLPRTAQGSPHAARRATNVLAQSGA